MSDISELEQKRLEKRWLETGAATTVDEQLIGTIQELEITKGELAAANASIDEVKKSHDFLVRELDVLLNGVQNAALQASLCDIVGQVRTLSKQGPVLSRIAELEQQLQRGLSVVTAAVHLCNGDATHDRHALLYSLDQALVDNGFKQR